MSLIVYVCVMLYYTILFTFYCVKTHIALNLLFYVYSSVALNVFTLLCNRSLELFILQS